jgi:DNA-binding XRE family transcriptional regulator
MNFKAYYKLNFKTKAEAAEKLGISRPYIYLLLKGGKVGPRISKRLEKNTSGAIKASQVQSTDNN